MAIKVGGTTVIDDSRALNNITSVDATTVAALGTAGVGGGGGSVDLQVSETVTAGDAVRLASNGNITKVSATAESSITIGSWDYIKPSQSQTDHHKIVYIPKYDYFVTFASDINDGNTGYWYTHSVSGTTPVVTDINNNSNQFSQDYIANPITAVYLPDLDRIAVVIQMSSFLYWYTAQPQADGSLVFNSSGATQITGSGGTAAALAYDSNSSRLVLVYRNPYSSYVPTYIVGTMDSNQYASINWGTPGTFPSGLYDENVDICFDETNNKVVIAYRSPANSNKGYIKVGDVNSSTNTVSWGNAVEFNNNATFGVSVDYDPVSGKVIIFYADDYNNELKARAASVSGTSATLGSSINVQGSASNASEDLVVRVDNSGAIVFIFKQNNQFKARLSSVSSGTNLNTVTSPVLIDNNNTNRNTADIGNGYFLAAARRSSSGDAIINAGKVATSNATEFVGVAAENIASGSTGEITIIGGVNESVSGLTAGSDYYVTGSGALETSGSLKIGRALASNKLLITSGGA